MGRSSPGVNDDLHGNQGRRNQQLDSLYQGQEGTGPMVGAASIPYKAGFQTSPVIWWILLNFVFGVVGIVKVTVPNVYFLVPENSNVNFTCSFTDNQGAGLDKITARWRWITGDQIEWEGVVTTWDDERQEGKTTLQISNMTRDRKGRYACVIWITGRFDYGFIHLQVFNISSSKEVGKGVQIIPTNQRTDMWDGPPLRINCTFRFTTNCRGQTSVRWWKWSKAQQSWEMQAQGISWWINGNEGKGWLNITNPRVGETEGKYLCVVTCGEQGDYGIRNVEAVPHQDQGVTPEHGYYRVKEGKELALGCAVQHDNYSEYGWWFRGRNLENGGRYKIEKRNQTIVLIVTRAEKGQDEGRYWCWIAQDDHWANGIITVSVGGDRVTRQVMETVKPRIYREKPENLVVGLIRDFGQVQNVSAITACLPLPQAAGDPIPWGIIPTPKWPKSQKDTALTCKHIPHTERVVKEMLAIVGEAMHPMKKSDCIISRGRIGRIIEWWVKDTNEAKWECYLPHYKREKINVTQAIFTWKCDEKNNTGQMEKWETIWGPSLLETYSYLGEVQWCIHWKGKTNQTYSQIDPEQASWRTEGKKVEKWNCSEILDCNSPSEAVSLLPVKVLLRFGCECRGYNHTIRDRITEGKLDCKTTTVHAPGNLVWVMGHGHWTTHMPVDGPATQITLGIPTLCPFWKPTKLTASEMQTRHKRDISQEIGNIGLEEGEDWHEPSAGVKFGWVLESLFAPISSYRNREMLHKLLGQTERLAAVTKKGFKDLNLQLQATSRMTIQNRMALDMILLKERGVCGYLHGRDEHCCIHIPNVTQEVEQDIGQLEQIEGKVDDIQKEAEHNWVGAIFSSLGVRMTGWISSIVQYGIVIVIIILVALMVYKCLLGMIVRESQHTRRMIKAITRREVLAEPSTPPPAYHETTT